MAAQQSKILVIGATGYIGTFVVKASAKAGHPTFALVREPSLSDPEKAKLVHDFKDLGITIVYGDVNDNESLVKAIKMVDVVISAIGSTEILDQTKIISAIKEAGNVKRFVPSEFGLDVDRTSAVEPAKSAFSGKAEIRRAIEKEGIPYTYIVSHFFAAYYLTTLVQFEDEITSPPTDKVTILGDGNVKVLINSEEDIAAYTIKTIDDPQTLNKILYIKPPKNTLSMNEMVSSWEQMIGKSLEKTYLSEEEVLKSIKETPFPYNIGVSINHSAFVKGDHTNFTIDPLIGVEASKIYPQIKYKTTEEYLTQFVQKSKILVIGATGYIGTFVVKASAKAGHPTFALVRKPSLSDPEKAKLVQDFKDLGITIVYGDVNDHESLVKAIKMVDVVISAIGSTEISDQTKIISAIKEAGNVKRFLPSEFGLDVDRTSAVEPAKSAFSGKVEIRRAIEKEGIPYTYIVSHFFAAYYLTTLVQFEDEITSPPTDKVTILGDGNAKVLINNEEDIAAYTIKTIDDPQTLNKIVYIKPPKNTLSMNEMVGLWEKMIGKSLEKTYLSEKEVLKSIKETPFPYNIGVSINHSAFVKGDHTNFTIDPLIGVEASKIYPEIKYKTTEEYLTQFV